MLLTGFAILWLIFGIVLAVLICIGKIPFLVFVFYWGMSGIFYFLSSYKLNKGKG